MKFGERAIRSIEELYTLTCEEEIIEAYHGPFDTGEYFESYYNPAEKTPSAMFQYHMGKLYYMDFTGYQELGQDVIDFVDTFFIQGNVSFSELLSEIYLRVLSVRKKGFAYRRPNKQVVLPYKIAREFTCEWEDLDEEYAFYYLNRNVSMEILELFEVKWAHFVQTGFYKHTATMEDPAYLYTVEQDGRVGYQSYRPLYVRKTKEDRNLKFRSHETKDLVFGMKQARGNGKLYKVGALVSSPKDVMQVRMIPGACAISAFGERAHIPKGYIEEFKTLCEKTVCFMDGDATGQAANEYYLREFGIPSVAIPKALKKKAREHKFKVDPDEIAARYSHEHLKSLLKSAM